MGGREEYMSRIFWQLDIFFLTSLGGYRVVVVLVVVVFGIRNRDILKTSCVDR